MERLWAPWRGEYISAAIEKPAKGTAAACVFCELLAADPREDRQHLILHRHPQAFVVMNRYPYNNGHLLVLPTAHVADFEGLEAPVFQELHRWVGATVRLLQAAMRPHGVNLGMNLGRAAGAGLPQHMHYHVVPRWEGDTNFMPVLAETRVISQHILETYDLLRPHFAALA